MRRTMLSGLLAVALVMGWATLALAQEIPTDDGPALVRIEVPEAGIAMAFPDDWSVVDRMVRDEAELPSETGQEATTDVYIVLEAAGPAGDWCDLGMYPDHPLTFAEHARWIEERYGESADVFSSVDATPLELPVGEAIRFDLAFADGTPGVAYLFETDQARYQLRCAAAERPEDDWLSIAETAESIPMVPIELAEPGDLGTGADVDVVLDFETTVAVVPADTPDFPLASLMDADCDFALWIQAADGSATEWLACTLNDSPMEPPEYQGLRPTETFIDSGGGCVWRSDYWYQTDRSEVVATAYELTVLPTGQVFARSTYPAEPLDCSGL